MAVWVALEAASMAFVGKVVNVGCGAVGNGVIGVVGEGVTEIVDVKLGCISGVLPVQLAEKITNKVNMTTLDEFNGI